MSGNESRASSRKSKDDRIKSRWLSSFGLMPPWCRWIPGNPPRFSIWMNLLFGFAGAFTVANLYYNHPILDILARDFNVPYDVVSQIPTLMQAGYAVGLLFLCPLGDMLKRRPFVLSLVFLSASAWIGLCITNNFTVFRVLSFIVAVTTVTPQIMLPLVGDLAPPHRRAASLSIVVSGNLMGILIARILSGVVTEYTSWRDIYWLALGLQYLVWGLLWLFMPDYPKTTSDLSYFKILWSMLRMLKAHAVLVQASLISFCTSACFTSFWTTLTFLLSGQPFNYSTLVIGLFALVGIAAMLLGPVYAKLFISKCVPTVSTYIGLSIDLLGVCIGTYTGRFTVAGPVIQAFALDAGMQITQIANRSAIYAVEPTGRNRINTVFMVFTFFGQITGTAAGNQLYAKAGWTASGSLSVGFIGLAFLVTSVRGPYAGSDWYGWRGGFSIRKRDQTTADGQTAEKSLGLAQADKNGPTPNIHDEEAQASADDTQTKSHQSSEREVDEKAANSDIEPRSAGVDQRRGGSVR